jgi:hypothetical protein
MNNLISTFNDISIVKNNTLVICDIDETIMHYPDCINKCKEIIKDLYIDSEEEYNKELQSLMNMYKHIHSPSHTDYVGFINLQNKINETNSKLIYLTARNKVNHDLTKKQLNVIGINCCDDDVHYTDNVISKGEYIKKNIQIDLWDDIIFIDDYPSYIQTVNEALPNVRCYQFSAKV